MKKINDTAAGKDIFIKIAPFAVLALALVLVICAAVPALNPIDPFSSLERLAPVLDENGEPVLHGQVDANGRPVMIPVLDQNGEPVMETVMEQAKGPLFDEFGEPVLNESGEQMTGPLFEQETDEDGMPLYGEGGEPLMAPVMKPVMVPELDEEGNTIIVDYFDEDGQPMYVQQKDDNGEPVFTETGEPVMVIERGPSMTPKLVEVNEQLMVMMFEPSAVASWKPLTLIAGRNADVTFFEQVSKASGESLIWAAWNGAEITRPMSPFKNNVNNTVIATLFALYNTSATILGLAALCLLLTGAGALLFPKRRWIAKIGVAASGAGALYSLLSFQSIRRLNAEIMPFFEKEAAKFMLDLGQYMEREDVALEGFALSQAPGLFVFMAAALASLAVYIFWVARRARYDKVVVELKKKNSKYGYVFTSPLMIGFFLVFIVILFNSALYSFNSVDTSRNLLTPVGLDNYNYALRIDPTYARSVLNQAAQLLPNLFITIIFSMVIANILNQKMRSRAFFRAVFFVPVILATGIIAYADVSNYLMDTMKTGSIDVGDVSGQGGFFAGMNVMRSILGSVSNNQDIAAFISSASSGVYNVITKSGVQILLFLASIQSISPSIYEAATIEGASSWECFWKVTFPMLTPAIIVNSLYTIIDALVNADNPIMTSIYNRAFGAASFGIAGAMAWFYFAVVVLYVGASYLLLIRVFKKQLA